MRDKNSNDLMQRAEQLIPGGVNSPVRAFRGVGGVPRFIKRARGPYLYDEDDNQLIDYIGSWGPMILGHADPAVVDAIKKAAVDSSSFGTPTKAEVDLAEMITARIPSVDRLRLVNSGTEATMSAIRLARGFTGRDEILKFEGCYHGHADHLLVKAGSGVATFGLPDSPGVPKSFAEHTLTLPYNDLEAVRALFEKQGEAIAAVIVEPIAGNMGLVPPLPEFLEGLRTLTENAGALLIFDEVMTGFRVHPQGAQGLFQIKPDLTTFGKIIGGGMPMGAYGGRGEVMDKVAPRGPVYQAGTLSGNPCAVAAGMATLNKLDDKLYEALEISSQELENGLKKALAESGTNGVVQRQGSMMTLFFSSLPKITNFSESRDTDHVRFGRYFHAMLERNIHLPPSGYEAMFLSAAHSQDIINTTINAAREALTATV